MKFTILGFSQKKLIEFNLDIDEALILRYFIDFKDSGAMVKEYIDDDMYYWINYESLKKELPILNVSRDRIYRKLKKLVEAEVLKHKTKKLGGTFSFYAIGIRYKDLIIDSSEVTDSPLKIPEGYGENNGTCPLKIPEGYGENNGTKYSSIKDSSNNNPSIKDTYKKVIDYLNKKLNSRYRYETSSTQKLVMSKLNAGFTLEEFISVIDKKYKDWKGTEYEKYLAPDTLFGNKFEKYLNQKIIKTAANSNGKQSTFNNHTQREYNFDELERRLLGWDNPEDSE